MTQNAVIGNLRVDLQLMHASFQKGIGQVQKDLGGLNSAVQGVQKTMLRFGAVAAGAVAGVGIANVSNLADTYSDLHSRVGLAAGSMDQATGIMKRLGSMALDTYSNFENTAQSFLGNVQVLKDLGLSMDQTLDYTEALNNAMVVSGAKGDQAARVQKALSDAMILGKLSGDQLNTILMDGGRVAQLLAEELGTTVSGLRQMGADGKITSDIIQNTLIKNMERVREEAAAMPGTIADGFTQIRTGFMMLVGATNEATGATESISAKMTSLGHAMKAVAESGAIEGIFNGIATTAEAAAYAIGILAVAKGTTLVVGATKAIGALSVMHAQFIAGAALSRAYTVAAAGLGKALAFVGGPVGALVTGVAVLGAALYATRTRVTDLKDSLADLQKQGTTTNDALNIFATNMNLDNAKMAFEKVNEELTSVGDNLKAQADNVAALKQQISLVGRYEDTSGLQDQLAGAEITLANLQARYESLTVEQQRLTSWTEFYTAELEEAKARGEAVTDEQKKAAAALAEMVYAQANQNALKKIENEHGKDSVQYAQEQLRQEREIEIAKINSLRATLEGADAELQKLDALIASTNAAYDAEAATLSWANAMAQVQGRLSGIAAILNQLGAGIGNVEKATTLKLIQSGVDPALARVQAARESELGQHDLKMKNAMGAGNLAEYARLSLERSQIVGGNTLDDQIDAASTAWTEANKSTGGGGGKGGKGRSSGKGRKSDAEREIERQKDAAKSLTEQLTMLQATWGMNDTESRIYAESQKIGTAMTKEQIAATVNQIETLEKMKDVQEELRSHFVSGFKDIVTGAKSAKEVLVGVLNDLASRFAEFAGNSFFDMVMGKPSGAAGGSGSGLLSSVLGLFGKSNNAVVGDDALSAALRGIPGFANGTNSSPSGLAWVGERGPEIVNLARGQSVMSTQKSMNMLASASQSSGGILEVRLGEGLEANMLQKAGSQSIKIVQDAQREYSRNGFQNDAKKFNRDNRGKG